MEESLFLDYIRDWFPGIVLDTEEELNARNYYFRRMLRKEYSVTGKWDSVSSINQRVMADIVAMDSPLPLKRRDSISKVSGDIPKLGMELYLNEKQLTELDVLGSQLGGRNAVAVESQMVQTIFQDVPRVIQGIEDRLEHIFLRGFSTGVALIDEDVNVGAGIRVDYGYPDANKTGVDTLWSNPASTPINDIKALIRQARTAGTILNTVHLDQDTFDTIAATDEARKFFAWANGMSYDSASTPEPDQEQLNRIAQRNGFAFNIIEQTVIFEKDGDRTPITPWDAGKVILTGTNIVGSLVWSFLAEMNHPIPNVSYQTANNYTLVSMFRQNRPSLSEYTNSQARVLPVISGVDKIYMIDSLVVNA